MSADGAVASLRLPMSEYAAVYLLSGITYEEVAVAVVWVVLGIKTDLVDKDERGEWLLQC